jgi:chemotaxis protein MotB
MSDPAEPARPIIIRKPVVYAQSSHHGGAWKVAYADFVTAMMAFFLLMWLLGATTEKQRKALADYFAPTIVERKDDSAGGNGPFGGDALLAKDRYPSRAGLTGERSITIPKSSGDPNPVRQKDADRQRFAQIQQLLRARVSSDKTLNRYARSLRFTQTSEGLRIDLVDDANFSMFLVGTNILTPEAMRLLPLVADALAAVPNNIRVRGHTDSSQFAAGGRNNWTLSSARADATRQQLMIEGIGSHRFDRIEGVADREPYDPGDPYAPVNRRISITLGWSRPTDEPAPGTV